MFWSQLILSLVCIKAKDTWMYIAFTSLAIGLFQKYHKLYSLLSLQNFVWALFLISCGDWKSQEKLKTVLRQNWAGAMQSIHKRQTILSLDSDDKCYNLTIDNYKHLTMIQWQVWSTSCGDAPRGRWHHVLFAKLSAPVAWIWAQTDRYYRSSIVDSLLEISKMSCFMFFFRLSSENLSWPLKNNPIPQTQPLKLLQLTSGFLQIFGSKIQDYFQTFFSKQ